VNVRQAARRGIEYPTPYSPANVDVDVYLRPSYRLSSTRGTGMAESAMPPSVAAGTRPAGGTGMTTTDKEG